MTAPCRIWTGCALLLLLSRSPAAAQTDSAYVPPDDIGFRQATIISEGTRIRAELFTLKSNDGKSLPTIIMCHGWGGTAELLRPDAVAFAIHDMNNEPKKRNLESHRNLRRSHVAPRPPFVPHNPGAPVSNFVGNNSVRNNASFHSTAVPFLVSRRSESPCLGPAVARWGDLAALEPLW